MITGSWRVEIGEAEMTVEATAARKAVENRIFEDFTEDESSVRV